MLEVWVSVSSYLLLGYHPGVTPAGTTSPPGARDWPLNARAPPITWLLIARPLRLLSGAVVSALDVIGRSLVLSHPDQILCAASAPGEALMLKRIPYVGNRPWPEKERGSPAASRTLSVAEWLNSPHLRRIVNHVALRHGVQSQDAPDIFQDVCISLIHKGMDSCVNAAFVFKTVASRIIDNYRRAGPGTEDVCTPGRLDTEVSVSQTDDRELTLLVRSKATLLPGRLRTFYILRYRMGLKQGELASRLGLSRGAVRHLERRCLMLLNRGSSGSR